MFDPNFGDGALRVALFLLKTDLVIKEAGRKMGRSEGCFLTCR